MPKDFENWLPICAPMLVPLHDIMSGMVTPLGLVLRVDRCAPEHGGGVLLMLVGNRQVAIDSSTPTVQVYGIVTEGVLSRDRERERAITGIDYSAGLR